jgi:hypothetical protein
VAAAAPLSASANSPPAAVPSVYAHPRLLPEIQSRRLSFPRRDSISVPTFCLIGEIPLLHAKTNSLCRQSTNSLDVEQEDDCLAPLFTQLLGETDAELSPLKQFEPTSPGRVNQTQKISSSLCFRAWTFMSCDRIDWRRSDRLN